MSYIDWKEWEEHKECIKQQKQEQKAKIRNLLESDIKTMEFTLKQFIDMLEDDQYKLDQMDLMEEALMKIADGHDNPQQIALDALKKHRGDD